MTATKFTRELVSVPAAVTHISFADGDEPAAGRGSSALASRVEGMALTAAGTGRNRMFLRGMADSPFIGESQATAAILLDAARITYSGPDPDIRLVDMDSVEVVRGPQGSLFGSGVLGGIYQMRTNRPQQGAFGLSMGNSVTWMPSGEAGFAGQMVVNAPILSDSVALRAVGYGAREGGWIDTGARGNSNRVSQFGGRAALALETGDGWQYDLSGMVQYTNSADSQYVYDAKTLRRPDQLPEPHDNDISLVAAHASGPLGAFHLILDSSLINHEVNDTFDATLGAQDLEVAHPLLLLDARQYRIWNSEARLEGELGRADWLVGLSRIEAEQDVLALLSREESDRPRAIDDDRRTSAETALFGHVVVPLTQTLALEAGGRLFTDTVAETRIVDGELLTRDKHRSGFTPALALSWLPRDGRLLWLRYGSAQRQAGGEIRSDGQLDTLESDELASLEFGWREQTGRGSQAEIGLFATRWHDVQSDMLMPDGMTETMNVGDARIFGAEASLIQMLGRGWRIEAGASLIDGKLVHDLSGQEILDTRLPVVPEYSLRAQLSRSLWLGNLRCDLRAGVTYTGPARLSFDPHLNREMGEVLNAQLGARLAGRGWRIDATIDNLFDRRDDTFAFGNRLRIFRMYQFTPLPPRSLTLSLQRQFR